MASGRSVNRATGQVNRSGTAASSRAALFGAAAPSIVESFAIGTVTHLPEGGGAPVVERAVLLAPGQIPKLLPGWVRLAS